MQTNELRIVATGDIAFTTDLNRNPSETTFKACMPLFSDAHLVIGNLECPLTMTFDPVPNKCTLAGDPAWAGILKRTGFGLVSLANNHLMDHGPQGLLQTMNALDSAGVRYVGAGHTNSQATAPSMFEIQGKSVCVLARSAVIVNSPCYATNTSPGVARFNEDETCSAIEQTSKRADVCIVLLHWGLEQYHYPSPKQRIIAERLAAAGADIIIGHHPHVVQGIETRAGSIVAYSLGNFCFGDQPWHYTTAKGIVQNAVARLAPENRKGLMLSFCVSAKKNVRTEPVFTLIKGNTVIIDTTPQRGLELKRLSRRLGSCMYSFFWHIYALYMEWNLRIKKNTLDRISLKTIAKIRPHHFVEICGLLKKSLLINAQKTTNPYD